MTKVTSSVDTDAVLERIGIGKNEELRQSSRRRRYLEKLSRVITPDRPSVQLDPNHPTACVNQNKDEPLIRVTTREFEQPASSLSRDVFDMTVQEGLLVHEIGHVLYTDHGAFQRTLSRVDLSRKMAYKRLWNTLEDGAIEEQLRRRFNVEDELYVLNANLMADKQASEMGDGDEVDEIADGNNELDLYGGVTIACMDLAVFDSGKFSRLMDESDDSLTMRSDVERELLEELVPITKDAIAEIKTEADPIERTERIYDYWLEVVDRLEEAEDENQEQQTPDGQDGDGDEGDGESEGLGQLFGDGDESDDEEGEGQSIVMPIPKPDDSENADIGGGESADELERQDEEEVREELEQAADPDSDSTDFDGDEADGEEEESGSSSGGSEEEERGDEIEEERRGQLREEAREVDGAEQLISDVEEYSEAMENMNQSGDYSGEVGLVIPQERNLNDRTRLNQAENRSRTIAQRLRSSLREERRSRRVKNQRRGRFDRSRMVNAERGSTRVFEQEQEGDEKDYDCLVVVDRSGSMGGSRMTTAEDAIVSFGLALEDVGVGISILGMYGNDANLENAFGRDIETDAGLLLSERTSGSTPLSKTLALGRERLENKADSDNPFMIVVTDGKPDDGKAYREELDKCTFPVLGVYVETGEEDTDLFHRQVHVEQGDIQQSLTQLAREVMM